MFPSLPIEDKYCTSADHWWNTVIRSAFYVLAQFCLQEPNIKGVFFFLESKTVDTKQQDSVAASEVSSWNR